MYSYKHPFIALALFNLLSFKINAESNPDAINGAEAYRGQLLEDLLEFPKHTIQYMTDPIEEKNVPSLIDQIKRFTQDFNVLYTADKNSSSEVYKVENSPPDQPQLVTYTGQVFQTSYPKKLKFLCSIPRLNHSLIAEQNLDTELSPDEKQQLIKSALDSIQLMGDKCLIYPTPFWKYEFCPKKYVRQFYSLPPKNPDSKTSSVFMEYFLGRFSGLISADLLKKKQETSGSPGSIDAKIVNDKNSLAQKNSNNENEANPELKNTSLKRINNKLYISQFWDDGTTCEVTNKPRVIEIQYQCGRVNEDIIYQVSEVSTCNYLIVIHTKKLCKHNNFYDPLSSTQLDIKCWPILNETEYSNYIVSKDLFSNLSDHPLPLAIPNIIQKDSTHNKPASDTDNTINLKESRKLSENDLLEKLFSPGVSKKLKVIKIGKDGKIKIDDINDSSLGKLSTSSSNKNNNKVTLGLKPDPKKDENEDTPVENTGKNTQKEALDDLIAKITDKIISGDVSDLNLKDEVKNIDLENLNAADVKDYNMEDLIKLIESLDDKEDKKNNKDENDNIKDPIDDIKDEL
ncbi:Protein OS-9-like protein [Smittium culicis]|uniref:Protein OS-9 homolog n=1 Tax=Smittium culicis TaxID=133412 RepID=A0A1R1XHW9_9FUNG|nr:Protein OS-9-like protein [Smittium culicis]